MGKTELYFGYGLGLAGVALPYLIEHLSGSTTTATVVCVLCLLAATVLLFLGYRSKAQVDGDAVAVGLFGGEIPPPPASELRQPEGIGQTGTPPFSLVRPYMERVSEQIFRNVEEVNRRANQRKPKLVVFGYAYPDLCCGDDCVWRSGVGSKALVFNIRNDPHEDGVGIDAAGVRAQILFTYSNGWPGPSFSPLPWIGERYGIINIPTGTERQLLIGIKMGPGGSAQGWMGYTTSRLNQDQDGDPDVLRGNSLADNGVLTLKLIAVVGGDALVVHESYREWMVDFGLNHPTFREIPKPQPTV
jgi:hypothetical protein